MKKREFKTRMIIVRSASDLFTPMALILGLYVILHGTVSPGGGFQGGVIVSAAAILMYLGHGYETVTRTFSMDVFHKGEAFAAIVYVVLALAGLFYGASFCRNVFFSDGQFNSLFGAGTIAYMNYTVGFKVLMGVSFLLMLILGMLAPEKDDAVKEPSELSFREGTEFEKEDAE